MFLKFDRLFARVRAAGRNDDRGASLILVIALMAMGFIASGVIVASCLFAVQQVSEGRNSVAAFAAAEAGRDAVVATLAADPDNCVTTNPHFTGTDPAYSVTIYATDSTTQPTSSTSLTASCPSETSTFVVLRSEGVAPLGGTTIIEAVYVWEPYREQVAGGGLGFMDAAYTAVAVDYSGDIVVRHGDFTCSAGTRVDGSVYVLDGRVIVPQIFFVGTSCDVTGDVVASDGIEVQNGFIGDSHLDVGGNVLVGGKLPNPDLPAGPGNVPELGNLSINDPMDVDGDIEVYGTITAAARLATDGSGRTDALGVPIKKADGTLPTGAITATGAITVSGILETTTGSIATNASISGNGTVRARLSVASGGSISTGGLVQATTGAVAAGTTIASTSGGDVIGAGVTAVGNITTAASGGLVSATAGNIISGGSISGPGTVTATGDVRAVTGINASASTGRVQAGAAGSLLSTGAVNVTDSAGVLQAGAVIATNGSISATGALIAANVRAGGTITSAGNCTVTANIEAGGTVNFSQRKPTSGAGFTCSVGEDIKAGLGVSALPTHTTSPNRPSQLFAKRALAKGTWTATRHFRDTNGTPINVATQGTPNQAASAWAAPATVVIPTPAVPAAVTVAAADFGEMYLRTRWVDLGKTTIWNGYDAFYALLSTECGASAARTRITNLLQTTGPSIVIDTTACTSISITGWTAVNLRRNAVLLVNNIQLQLIRFNQTGATALEPRQLFIVQTDDNLTLAPPASNPTGDPEPQPHCGGRSNMNIWGSGWGGLAAWDPLVRVLLYSPCGSENTSALSEWRGHLYVANNTATTDIIASVDCEPMWVEGTFDLPCNVNDFAEWTGVHTEDGKRIGDRTYQTEP